DEQDDRERQQPRRGPCLHPGGGEPAREPAGGRRGYAGKDERHQAGDEEAETQYMPCCMAKTNREVSVACLSPDGSAETVNPDASFPLSACDLQSRPVASMNALNGAETPPR